MSSDASSHMLRSERVNQPLLYSYKLDIYNGPSRSVIKPPLGNEKVGLIKGVVSHEGYIR